ncbi:MAG: hypothetical protein WDZ41_04105 [Candidatus Babeliales bacterium]
MKKRFFILCFYIFYFYANVMAQSTHNINEAPVSYTYKKIEEPVYIEAIVTDQEAAALKTEPKKEKDLFEKSIEAATKGLKKFWDSFKWKDFKEKFKKQYEFQHIGQKAYISKGVKLTSQGSLDPVYSHESVYLTKRTPVAQKALENYTKLKLTPEELPRIACAFSGGGYRAMVLTVGYLKAFEDMGLLDSIFYISTLSGSTWCLGPWTLMQDFEKNKKVTINAFKESLLEKIRKNQFNLFATKYAGTFNVKKFAERVIWSKVLFDQIINSVDLYGATLSHVLLADFGDDQLTQRLSAQWMKVREGNHVWPIYTAVSMHKTNGNYRYNWYEFNPEEIRNLEYNLVLPSYAFGRKFDNGVNIDFSPQQSFGFLMGIFGSAYTVNLKDIKRIVFGYEDTTDLKKLVANWYKKPLTWAQEGFTKLSKIFTLAAQLKFKEIWNMAKDDLQKIQATVFAQLLSIIADTKIQIPGTKKALGTSRVAPAQIANPFKGYKEIALPWLVNRDYLTFVDAGVDYNIPLLPLFRPERKLDIIIIGDASGDVTGGSQELSKALADIKRVWGVDYTKDNTLSSKTIEIYRPVQENYPLAGDVFKAVRPPLLIYFNFLKDNNLMKNAQNDVVLKKVIEENKLMQFNPEECINSFCSTFNFNYTQEQFKQLTGIAEFNIKAHGDIIEKIIDERIDLLVQHPEFGG